MSKTTTTEQLQEQVRARYAAAAVTVTSGQGTASCCDEDCGDGGPCCGPTLEVDDTFGSALYAATDRDSLPVAAVAASLGCGNPTAVAALGPGERVLDLGSGGGIDVLLSARRVGQTGFHNDGLRPGQPETETYGASPARKADWGAIAHRT